MSKTEKIIYILKTKLKKRKKEKEKIEIYSFLKCKYVIYNGYQNGRNS